MLLTFGLVADAINGSVFFEERDPSQIEASA